MHSNPKIEKYLVVGIYLGRKNGDRNVVAKESLCRMDKRNKKLHVQNMIYR